MLDRRVTIPLAGIMSVVLAAGGVFYWVKSNAPDSSPPPTLQQRFDEGMKAVAENDLDAARSAVKKLESSFAFRDHARILRAAVYLQQNSPREAVQELAAEPVVEQVRVPASLLLAEAFHRLGDLANAQQAANFAVKLDPDHPAPHRRLAAVYYDLGANAAAVAELEQVAKLAPEDFRPYHLMGQISFDAENFQAAVTSLNSALERNPSENERTDIVLYLAQSLLKIHQYEEAARLLDEHAGNRAALLALNGEAQWAIGNFGIAKQLITKAYALDPANRFVLLQNARMAIHEGRIEPAIKMLERQLESDPHDTESRYQLALCFRRLGMAERYQEEFARFEESQKLKRELADLSDQAAHQLANAEIRDQIADLFEKLGRPKIAATYRQAAEACRQIHK